MKIVTLICACLMLTACAPRFYWVMKYVPTTEAERKAVAEHVEKIMAATPSQLSGHDQDWDDAIHAAHDTACVEVCRPTLWEKCECLETGRWKYSEEVKIQAQ